LSFAYHVAAADVFLVLEAHEAAESEDDDAVLDALYFVRECDARISEVALEHDSIHERQLAVWHEIEAILIEEGYLEEPPRLSE
jgi:hypothetical protein